MKKLKSYFDFNKENRNGAFVLVGILLIVQVVFFFYKPTVKIVKPTELQRSQVALLQKELNSQKEATITHTYFNPNELSKEEWQGLGFSEKQAHTILKYKKSLGGAFKTKKEIASCFVISESKFKELEPFIRLSTHNKSKKHTSQNKKHQNFNPNELSKEEWQGLGFSEKQAHTILKYKKSLGGRFKTKKEIASCFVISESKFKELEPFIRLSIHNKSKKHTSQNKIHQNFNPNKLSKEEWQGLGFSEKQAHTILKYKKSLGGAFKTKEEIASCFVISELKFKELEPFIIFEKIEKLVKPIEKEINSFDLNLTSYKNLSKYITVKKARRIVNYRKALGGFYDWSQLKEIQISLTEINYLKNKFNLEAFSKKMNVNKEAFSILKKHPYIDEEFIEFLKYNRKNDIKLLSFQEISENFKNKELNDFLEYYLIY